MYTFSYFVFTIQAMKVLHVNGFFFKNHCRGLFKVCVNCTVPSLDVEWIIACKCIFTGLEIFQDLVERDKKFDEWTLLDHLNIKLVCYSDLLCIGIVQNSDRDCTLFAERDDESQNTTEMNFEDLFFLKFPKAFGGEELNLFYKFCFWKF